MSQPRMIIAIDGPAGAGKSSIAARVAKALGMTRVDTGAIYRCVTLVAVEEQLSDAEIPPVLSGLHIRFEGDRVFIGDRDVSQEIRSPEVTAATSRVSALPAVRQGLLALQRRLALEAPVGAVMEGRDIGTVVFPDAPVKVYLTASSEERARRRLKDLHAAGQMLSLEEVLEAIETRDASDRGRAAAPLRAPEDATRVDSTGKTPDQVVAEIVALAGDDFPVASNASDD